MLDAAPAQHVEFEEAYEDTEHFAFHDDPDPLIRFVRDRRLNLAIGELRRRIGDSLAECSVLVVCGGVGGEATHMARRGFTNVTNSDYSANALDQCRQRDPRLKTVRLDAERMDLDDESFDLVVVQDGLHHLRRPALGLNEMLRVAKRGVVVIEPHRGLVGRVLGQEWEDIAGTRNYVFRWDADVFAQVIRSQLVRDPADLACIRLWDHGQHVHRVATRLPPRLRLATAKLIYLALRPFSRVGNMFVGVAVK
jgi:SAM-dependent methyltransferase